MYLQVVIHGCPINSPLITTLFTMVVIFVHTNHFKIYFKRKCWFPNNILNFNLLAQHSNKSTQFTCFKFSNKLTSTKRKVWTDIEQLPERHHNNRVCNNTRQHTHSRPNNPYRKKKQSVETEQCKILKTVVDNHTACD